MDLPNEVLVHNEILGIKGGKGTLVAISPHGYYEANLRFGQATHRVLLPIETTVIISRQPEEAFLVEADIER
jgi:hypothetical protein